MPGAPDISPFPSLLLLQVFLFHISRAYQGYKIPSPIVIRPDEQSSTPIEEIAKEVLAFTKLDWNSSHFCKKFPVTIEVSRSVGDVLAEPDTKKLKEIDPHCYFCM